MEASLLRKLWGMVAFCDDEVATPEGSLLVESISPYLRSSIPFDHFFRMLFFASSFPLYC